MKPWAASDGVTVPVGLDVGTTGVKGLAISAEGEVMAAAEETYGLSLPQSGWAEPEPDDWWRAAKKTRRS